jgi:hypothetical protein
MERVRAAHPSLRSGVMALISCVGRQGPAAGPQRLHAPFEGDQGTAALAYVEHAALCSSPASRCLKEYLTFG